MTGRMQIDRFSVQNFRAIQHCDVELSPVTFFIGANASGKTSYVEALIFLQKALRESLERAALLWGGAKWLVHHPATFPSNIHFHLSISSSTHEKCEYDLLLQVQDADSITVVREECRLQNAGGEQHFYLVTNDTVRGSAAALPGFSQDRIFLANASALPEFRGINDFLAGIAACEPIMPAFYRWATGMNSQIRKVYPARDEIGPAPRLRLLREYRPDQVAIIENYLRPIAPQFDGLEVFESDGMSWLRFVEKPLSGGPLYFPISQSSAGMVNATDILLELFDLVPGKPASPAIIEEPEALLHPGAIHVMRDAFFEASKIRQVLVTTHSPDLLDDDSVPADWIRAVYRDENGTHIRALDDGTKSVIRDHLYTPGQLLRQGGLITSP